MAGLTRILTLLCVAGRHLSTASPALRSALVVRAGQNVSLTCNLTSSVETTWYLLRSDQLLPLLTITLSKLDHEDAVDFQAADSGRFNNKGRLDSGPIGLDILEVQETDAGLYFCTGRCAGAGCVSRGTHLVVDGAGGDSVRQPCWSLGICALPGVLALGFIFVFLVGLGLCSGKPAGCCCRTTCGTTQDEALHYSSLKHAHRPRPAARGLVEEDVTYSAVANRKNLVESHDRR